MGKLFNLKEWLTVAGAAWQRGIDLPIDSVYFFQGCPEALDVQGVPLLEFVILGEVIPRPIIKNPP